MRQTGVVSCGLSGSVVQRGPRMLMPIRHCISDERVIPNEAKQIVSLRDTGARWTGQLSPRFWSAELAGWSLPSASPE